MNTRYAILSAALAISLIASPTLAQSQMVGVAYADLDLNTPAGQAALDRRIEAAAKSVCGFNEVRTATRLPSSSSRDCLREALASTREQVAAQISRETHKRG